MACVPEYDCAAIDSLYPFGTQSMMLVPNDLSERADPVFWNACWRSKRLIGAYSATLVISGRFIAFLFCLLYRVNWLRIGN